MTNIIEPAVIAIPPGVELNAPTPRYLLEANESKRLKAIAYLGNKWVLAKTRQYYLARVRGMV